MALNSTPAPTHLPRVGRPQSPGGVAPGGWRSISRPHLGTGGGAMPCRMPRWNGLLSHASPARQECEAGSSPCGRGQRRELGRERGRLRGARQFAAVARGPIRTTRSGARGQGGENPASAPPQNPIGRGGRPRAQGTGSIPRTWRSAPTSPPPPPGSTCWTGSPQPLEPPVWCSCRPSRPSRGGCCRTSRSRGGRLDQLPPAPAGPEGRRSSRTPREGRSVRNGSGSMPALPRSSRWIPFLRRFPRIAGGRGSCPPTAGCSGTAGGGECLPCCLSWPRRGDGPAVRRPGPRAGRFLSCRYCGGESSRCGHRRTWRQGGAGRPTIGRRPSRAPGPGGEGGFGELVCRCRLRPPTAAPAS
mmetsp:Transcript_1864/g.4129  ORF Transcript_1864/g.4129 Transcript_1864/m.4129 type:complete len:358 (+) Transcript_1864:56-1129(+)